MRQDYQQGLPIGVGVQYLSTLGELYGQTQPASSTDPLPVQPHVANAVRRLPPFSRTIAEALAAGKRFDNGVWIFAGSAAWTYRDDYRVVLGQAMLLPDGANSTAYCWPVAGLECLVVQAGTILEEVLLQLAYTLLGSGATVVRIIANGLSGQPYLSVHKPKEVVHAA